MSQEQKQLNVRVMESMKKNGSFYDLHAKLLSRLSEEIKGSDISCMKPYKSLKGEKPFQVAEDMVVRYLTKNKMENTLRSMQSEFPGSFIPRKKDGFAESHLELEPSNQPILSLFTLMNSEMDSVFFENRDMLREKLAERLSAMNSSRRRENDK